MKNTNDYNFNLPEGLIAQTPLQQRDQSRLLVLNRANENITHDKFVNLIDYLNEGDVLVMNDSRVIPARLHGIKASTQAHIEILMLKDVADDVWETLCKPAKRVKLGSTIVFGDNDLQATCIEKRSDGICLMQLQYEGILLEILERLGTMPLPPYIKEALSDQERYQTVYSKISGSAAAPTAGLHFTQELLDKIAAKNIKLAYITLHVGLGTFKPVSVTNIDEHVMHSEVYQIDDANAAIIQTALDEKRRIVSVGTTSTRTLEAVYQKYQHIPACSGSTDIFIYPGFQFQVVDAQITNFHLPKSTLMMLVSAFANRDLIMKAYQSAIENQYRFFSFGDSMLIL
jgi:S-adenosylmethionine:tRNA ribosyltransferase-isomerase